MFSCRIGRWLKTWVTMNKACWCRKMYNWCRSWTCRKKNPQVMHPGRVGTMGPGSLPKYTLILIGEVHPQVRLKVESPKVGVGLKTHKYLVLPGFSEACSSPSRPSQPPGMVNGPWQNCLVSPACRYKLGIIGNLKIVQIHWV